MDKNIAYFYFRVNHWLIDEDLCKQGYTMRNPFERNKEYKTYERKEGYFVTIISVSKLIIKNLDNTTKKYFHHLNVQVKDKTNDGGEEYFHKEIIIKFQEYLIQNNIKHHVLSEDEINNLKRQYIIKQRIKNLNKQQIKNLLSLSFGKIIPSDIQYKICMIAIKYFETNDIGKIIWACGCGKTKLSILLFNALKSKKIVIGVPSIFLQTQFLHSLLEANIDPENILLVGSINNTIYNTSNNINDINLFYNKERPISIIIVVYQSSHLLKNLLFDFKIGDEAHHLVGRKDENNKKTNLAFHDIQAKKTLFMTATEKIIKNNTDAFSMDNKCFGDYIDTRTFKWAIENKKITDYNLLVMYNTIDEISAIATTLNICIDYHDLFLSAFMVLKSIVKYDDLTHIVLYTNSIEDAIIVKDYIDEILSKNIFDIDDIYNEALYASNKIDLVKEVNTYKTSKIGIISSVYIFGEGFDLPKLNGVCFCKNMESETRITQCASRANRLEYNNPNKIAYIIIPYLDNGDWNDENDSFKKLRKIIGKLRNINENIEHKIKLYTTNIINKTEYEKSDIKNITLNDNPIELNKIKIRLRHSTSLMSNNIWKDQYEYLQILNKQNNIMSKQDYLNMKDKYDFYIDEPEKYFNAKILWTNWYDFICVDTSVFIQTKDEWKEYCKSLNICTLDDYKKMCLEHDCLPIDPSNFYLDFTSVINELNSNKQRR